MPNEKSRALYRGHFIPQKAGDVLTPKKDKDNGVALIHASEDEKHPAAYGF